MAFIPHLTVAAVVEHEGRFLMVEERVEGRIVWNQPAGHLDDGESLIAAVKREVLEETAWEFTPEHVSGVYLWRSPLGETFLRVCFGGQCVRHHPGRALDDGILRSAWLTRAELAAQPGQLRSPLVLLGIDDALDGRRYPLELLTHLEAGR